MVFAYVTYRQLYILVLFYSKPDGAIRCSYVAWSPLYFSFLATLFHYPRLGCGVDVCRNATPDMDPGLDMMQMRKVRTFPACG